MSVQYRQARTLDELYQILRLQQQNLPAVLSESEQRQDGFLTVAHELPLLRKMNERCPHIVALDGLLIAGYALCMHPEFRNEIPVIEPMFDKIDEHLQDTDSYIVMGQVCISRDYRRKGIFRGLYQFMRETLKDDYDYIVTEVDARNTRSLKAHLAVGFEELEVYHANGRDWHLISLPTQPAEEITAGSRSDGAKAP